MESLMIKRLYGSDYLSVKGIVNEEEMNLKLDTRGEKAAALIERIEGKKFYPNKTMEMEAKLCNLVEELDDMIAITRMKGVQSKESKSIIHRLESTVNGLRLDNFVGQ